MGRNYNRLREVRSSLPTKGKQFLHLSMPEKRESIEASGLKPSKPSSDEFNGVYMFEHPGEIPHENWVKNASQYAGDIYNIEGDKLPQLYRDEGEAGIQGYFVNKRIPTSDFKRTGHIFHNVNGHAEIHWHREEECPNNG
jgi:hypothetical protein